MYVHLYIMCMCANRGNNYGVVSLFSHITLCATFHKRESGDLSYRLHRSRSCFPHTWTWRSAWWAVPFPFLFSANVHLEICLTGCAVPVPVFRRHAPGDLPDGLCRSRSCFPQTWTWRSAWRAVPFPFLFSADMNLEICLTGCAVPVPVFRRHAPGDLPDGLCCSRSCFPQTCTWRSAWRAVPFPFLFSADMHLEICLTGCAVPVPVFRRRAPGDPPDGLCRSRSCFPQTWTWRSAWRAVRFPSCWRSRSRCLTSVSAVRAAEWSVLLRSPTGARSFPSSSASGGSPTSACAPPMAAWCPAGPPNSSSPSTRSRLVRARFYFMVIEKYI